MNGWEDLTVDLSEQHLVECTYQSDCEGTYDVEHVMKQVLKGIPREEDYPYNPFNSHPGICYPSNPVHVSDNFLKYYDITDEEIITILQTGPKVLTISATNW